MLGLDEVDSSSTVFNLGRGILVDGGLAAPELTTEDKLLETEWPRIVDIELSVSEEMVERGLMYSTLSEKPTLALDGGRRGDESESSWNKPFRSGVDSRSDGCDDALFMDGGKPMLSLLSTGVTGALPERSWPFALVGCNIVGKSWTEIAPDLR